jgi:hypothetical protein
MKDSASARTTSLASPVMRHAAGPSSDRSAGQAAANCDTGAESRGNDRKLPLSCRG